MADEIVEAEPAAGPPASNEAAGNTPFEGVAEPEPEPSGADGVSGEGEPGPESSDATTPDAPPGPAAPAVVLSPALVAQAARAGLEDADISECGSDAELQRMIRAVGRRTPQTDSGAQVADAPKLEDIPELADPEQYGEPLTKWGKAVRDHVMALRTQLEGMQKFHQQRELDAHIEWFESQLGVLEHGTDLFGTGPGGELKPGKELENREKLWNAMATIRRGYAGRAAPVKSAMLKQAHQMVFAGEVERLKQAKLGQHLAQRKGQFTLPPTQRAAGETLKGDAKAISSVQKKLDAKKKR